MSSVTDAFEAFLNPEDSKERLELILETQKVTGDEKIDPRDLAMLKIGSMLHELIGMQESVRLEHESQKKALQTTNERIERFKVGGWGGDDDDPEAVLRRRRRWKILSGIGGTIGTAGAAFLLYWIKYAPPSAPEIKPEDVRDEVMAAASDVEEQVGDLEIIINGDPKDEGDAGIVGKLDWLNKQDEDKTILIVDTTDFLGLKLDAISKKAKSIKPPPSVNQARNDAKDIREERRIEKATEKNPFKK